MSDTEFKKFDTKAKYLAHNVRLTADAKELKPATGDKAAMVKVTFVDTSRQESDEEMWIDVIPQDYQADLAGFLRKGDVISVEAKLTFRKYTHNGETRYAHDLRRAELIIPPALFTALKERGFTPGAKGSSPAKKGPPAAAKKAIRDLDD